MGDTTLTPAIVPEVSFQLLLGDSSPLEKEGFECQDVVQFFGYPDEKYDSGLRDRSCKKKIGDTTFLYEQTLWTNLKNGLKSSISAGLYWRGSVLIKGKNSEISVSDRNLNGELDEGDSLAILGSGSGETLRYRRNDRGQWLQTSGDSQGPLSSQEVKAIVNPIRVSYESAVEATGLPQIPPSKEEKTEIKKPIYVMTTKNKIDANIPRIKLRLGDLNSLQAKDFLCKYFFRIGKSQDDKGYTGYQGSLCGKREGLSEKINEDWTNEESKLSLRHLLWMGRDQGETRLDASAVELSIEIFWQDAVKIPIIVRKNGSVRWTEEARLVKIEDLDANGKLDGTDRIVIFQKRRLPKEEDNLNQADQYHAKEGQWFKMIGDKETSLTSQEEKELKRALAPIEEKYQAAFKEADLTSLGD